MTDAPPFRSLDQWPRKRTANPLRSKFKDDYQRTLRDLEREMKHLQARDVVILADCSASDLRRDGSLYAGTKLKSQGIILCFTGKHGPVKMPCDRYDDWRCNLRAITVSLEALRAVDRHGVTTSGEQYRGWTALPPGGGVPMPPAEFESVLDAAEHLVSVAYPTSINVDRHRLISQAVGLNGDYLATVFRVAARNTHPDHGGSAERLSKVVRAREFIERGGA